MNLVDSIFDIGLEYNIGSGGKRLTAVQRQKLAVARVLLKRPDYGSSTGRWRPSIQGPGGDHRPRAEGAGEWRGIRPR